MPITPPSPPKTICKDRIKHINMGAMLHRMKIISKQVLYSRSLMENLEIKQKRCLMESLNREFKTIVGQLHC